MPKTTVKIIGFIFCMILLTNCKKEGCIDEMALNYDPKAKVTDFSCIYAGDPYIGTYEITDSLYLPTLTEISTIYQKVNLIGTNSDTLYLTDYRNTNYELFIVMAGESFTVPEQEIWEDQLVSGSGLFRNDSLFYLITGPDYNNRGNGGKF
ncbi:MAG: hypothetical protein ACI8ZM_001155 [Crocinitomix sp.]|jgi:hypothetical protein